VRRAAAGGHDGRDPQAPRGAQEPADHAGRRGFSSINVELRKRFDLYANVRPAISFPNTKSRYENIDLITVRENTEGAYIGEGPERSAPTARPPRCTQRVTRKGSERIVRYAFDLARRVGRKKVTVVHKANILKSTSGLFLKVAREVAAQYPDIQCNEMIVDNTCMQLVMKPEQFDVIVTTNLFGDIISDLCAGLVGGLGLAPGANIGASGDLRGGARLGAGHRRQGHRQPGGAAARRDPDARAPGPGRGGAAPARAIVATMQARTTSRPTSAAAAPRKASPSRSPSACKWNIHSRRFEMDAMPLERALSRRRCIRRVDSTPANETAGVASSTARSRAPQEDR
jgi:hypothetical protein